MGLILYVFEVFLYGGDMMFVGVQVVYDVLDLEIKVQIFEFQVFYGNEYVFGCKGIEYWDMKG